METEDLKNIWHEHDNILEQSLRLNILCIETIQSQKSKSKLKPLLIFRLIEAFIQIKIILLLCDFLYINLSEIVFVIASAVLIIFFLVAFYMCLSQIIVMAQINYSESVAEIQEKLTRLQTHLLDYFRLSFLVFPFWIAYPVVGFKMVADVNIFNFGDTWWWVANLMICMFAVPLSIWVFLQVSYKNINKKWVRFLIRNAGGQSVTKAMDFLKEIKEFKRD